MKIYNKRCRLTLERVLMLGQLITFVVLVILDIILTMQVLQNGIATELNGTINVFIQETSLTEAMLIKLILSFVVVCILYETWHRKESFSYFNEWIKSDGAKLAYQGIMTINVLYILIVLNNLLVYTDKIEPVYAVIRKVMEWSKSIY